MRIRLAWELPAEASLVALCRRTTRMMLEHGRVLETDIDDVELIIGELCANVVRHAYDSSDGRYTVEVAFDGREVALAVRDHGQGLPSPEAPEPMGFTEDGGMGFFLMRQFSDRLELGASDGGGCTVVARRRLQVRNDRENGPTTTTVAYEDGS